MNTPTPTPRTDAIYLQRGNWANEEELRDECARLERELAQERARLDRILKLRCEDETREQIDELLKWDETMQRSTTP